MQLFSPPDSTNPDMFAAVVDRLGGAEAIEALARRHSAFHRARHIKSAADLLRLILAYAPGGRSLRRLAAEAAATGIVDVSDVALLARFRRCGDWLIALCENQLARRDEPGGRTRQNRVRLIDGSRIEGPGETCFRLHLCYDVAGQRIADFAITPLDKGETLNRVRVEPGDIAIADRGYPQPDGMRATRDAGADLLVRLTWNSLNLRNGAGEPVDWLDLFAKADADGHVDMPVTVHKARGRFEPLPMRLVVTPKPPDIAERARDVARQVARKDQRNVDPRTLKAAGYMILITSLDASAFPPHWLVRLYRVRWQIELAFKRLKSILRLDRLPAKDPGLARAWIAAHLLFALLIEDTTAQTQTADFSPS
jgi:Transposase DDE domain